MSLAAWRVSLRIARRNAFRSKARTALVVALIGLPVFAASGADLLTRTSSPPVEQRVEMTMGAAEAVLLPRVDDHGERIGRSAVDPDSVLPPGSRWIGAPRGRDVALEARGRRINAALQLFDTGDPIAHGMTVLRSGRHPKAPDEVALSRSAAARLGLSPGRTLDRQGRTYRVVGIADSPQQLSRAMIYAPEASRFAGRSRLDYIDVPGVGDTTVPKGPVDVHLVDLAGSPDKERLRALAARADEQDAELYPRLMALDPGRWGEPLPGQTYTEGYDTGPSGDAIQQELQTIALGALIVGFGLLEVALLAGTAFAVGARRQRRELGLLGAIGGSPGDVFRGVLAQGIVLGGLGAALGAVLGPLAVVAGRPFVEILYDQQVGHWGFAPSAYAGFAVLGMVSGLIAAIVPAVIAAGSNPVDALADRESGRITRLRPPKAAIATVVAGIGAVLVGSVVLAQQFDENAHLAEMLRRHGHVGTTPESPGNAIALALLGFVLVTVGVIRLLPYILDRLATFARTTPLSLRLAFRDAGRHRHRSVPAVAAIMIAVAATTGLAFFAAAGEARTRAEYQPSVVHGDATFVTDRAERAEDVAAIVEALDASGAHPIRLVYRKASQDLTLSRPTPDGDDAPELPAVVEPGLLRVIMGDRTDRAAAAIRALESGRAVVVRPGFAHPDGTAHLSTDDGKAAIEVGATFIETPVTYADIPPVLLSADTARRLGLRTEPSATYIDNAGMPSQARQDRAAAVGGAALRVERGPEPMNSVILLILIGAAGFVTLVGVGISVALSAAESRADLATLGAVGASSRRRRRLAAAQAVVVGGLGAVTGVLLGCLLAVAAQSTQQSPIFAVPWSNLALTGLGVPLLAAACAYVLTRSRLPMVRRIE